MCDLLYRGINLNKFILDNKQLVPKGKTSKGAFFLVNLKRLSDAKTLGPSELNVAWDHQTDNECFDSCYISTSKELGVAKKFATTDRTEDGVVVVLDRSKFDTYGVVAYEFEHSENPNEHEVTIRSLDNGAIPEGVIVGIQSVSVDY